MTERPLGLARDRAPEHEDDIERVIGLPGETVGLWGGNLFVDDRPRPRAISTGPRHIAVRAGRGLDAALVLCDNRTTSNDSRIGLGFIAGDTK